MERISVEEIRDAAWRAFHGHASSHELSDILYMAANTLEERDKDIAVYEYQIQEMQRQYGLMQREERDE